MDVLINGHREHTNTTRKLFDGYLWYFYKYKREQMLDTKPVFVKKHVYEYLRDICRVIDQYWIPVDLKRRMGMKDCNNDDFINYLAAIREVFVMMQYHTLNGKPDDTIEMEWLYDTN